MSRPPRRCSSTDGWYRLPSHSSQIAGDAGHHRQVGVDDAGAVAVGAGPLGVGAEQRRLHAVGLGERLADRVEQPGVGRRVAPSRAADRALVDRHHARARGGPTRGPVSSCLSRRRRSPRRAPRAGCRRRRRLGCGRSAPRTSSVPVGVRTAPSGVARSSRWRPVRVPLARSSSTVPSNRRCRPPCRRPGRGRRRGRRWRSSRARAPPRARCCPCPAAAAAGRSSAGRRGGAGPRWARRRRR